MLWKAVKDIIASGEKRKIISPETNNKNSRSGADETRKGEHMRNYCRERAELRNVQIKEAISGMQRVGVNRNR